MVHLAVITKLKNIGTRAIFFGIPTYMVYIYRWSMTIFKLLIIRRSANDMCTVFESAAKRCDHCSTCDWMLLMRCQHETVVSYNLGLVRHALSLN